MLFFFSGKLFDEKIFNSLSSLNQPHFVKNFAVIAGAKVHPFSACASFLQLFFWSFFRFHLNALEMLALDLKVFFLKSAAKAEKIRKRHAIRPIFTILRHQRAFKFCCGTTLGAQYRSRRFQKWGGLSLIAPMATLPELSRHPWKVAGSERRQREMHILTTGRPIAAEKIFTNTYYIICKTYTYIIGEFIFRDNSYALPNKSRAIKAPILEWFSIFLS